MIMQKSINRLFTIHGELGYFDLFGQMKLIFMIFGPRGYGKSELFYKIIETFKEGYIRFVPVCSDGIIFHLDSKNNIHFLSSGKHLSIRGRDGLSWDRKDAIEISYDHEIKLSKTQIKNGILLVGALGIQSRSVNDRKKIIRERGHKISVGEKINLSKISNPNRYLFNLIRDMIQSPAYWKQLVIHEDGSFYKMKGEGDYRIINKIIEYLPSRVLELTLPESRNKWGQLNDVFTLLVKKLDALFLITVEEMLGKMIKTKMRSLVMQVQHEILFPFDKQLADLSGIPEILTIKSWIGKKIVEHGKAIGKEIPQRVAETIESGILTIQTAFIEKLGRILQEIDEVGPNKASLKDLEDLLSVHSIAINELNDIISEGVSEKLVLPETAETVMETKKEIETLDKFLDDVKAGKI